MTIKNCRVFARIQADKLINPTGNEWIEEYFKSLKKFKSPEPSAWRDINNHKSVRSEPPHKDYEHLWEPLFSMDDL